MTRQAKSIARIRAERRKLGQCLECNRGAAFKILVSGRFKAMTRCAVHLAAHAARALRSKMPAIAFLLILGVLTDSAGQIVSEAFLDDVAKIESSGRADAVGDNGKALGMFQLHRAAWEDARRSNSKVGDYETGALSPDRARLAAKTYLTILAVRFEKRTGRPPSKQELYALYNVGFGRFFQLGGKLENCPATTRKAVRKIRA